MTRATALVVVGGLLLTGCGSSSSTPSNPTGPSPAPAPTAARLDLSASPGGLLLSGSSVTITGKLSDASGAAVPNRSVQLSTSAGTLSATLPTTNQSGEFTATLTGNSAATVLGSTAGASGALEVPGIAPFSVSVEPKYSVIAPGDSDDLFVTLTPVQGFANAPTASTLSLACGNGDTVNLGDKRTATCRYTNAGSYTVTVTATSSGGWSATGTTTVTVESQVSSLMLTARRVAGNAAEVEMEFNVEGAPSTSVCSWDLFVTKREGSCHQQIVYSAGDADGNGHVQVKVDVDTKQGHEIQHLELDVDLGL